MAGDLTTPDEILRAFIRTRASLEPDDVCTWFRGVVRIVATGLDAPRSFFGTLLFRVEGCSVARAVAVDGGFDVLVREAMIVRDPVTDEIVDQWPNPMTGSVVEVLHGWCDPANERYRVASDESMPMVNSLGDDITFAVDRFDTGPNPLTPKHWPRESTGPVVATSTVTHLLTTRRALDGRGPSVPSWTTVTRTMPWLPWMLMGGHPSAGADAALVMSVSGTKVGAVAGLPPALRRAIEERRPEFLYAPRSFAAPNETPWTLYAKERRPAR